MRILDFAIDVEQAEQELYQRLANCSEDLGVKAIFRRIAADEGKLLKKLLKLRQDSTNCELEVSVPRQEEKMIRRNQGGSCELLEQNHVSDDLSSYNYILRTEQLLLNLYANLKDREQDPEARGLLSMILTEKQEEIDRVHMLYDFVRSPKPYLS